MTKSSISSEPELAILLNSSKGANSRKKVLKTLFCGSKSCNQVATKLGLNWRTAYAHLQILERESLVKSFGFGQRKFYKLTLKGAFSKCVHPRFKKEFAVSRHKPFGNTADYLQCIQAADLVKLAKLVKLVGLLSQSKVYLFWSAV